MELLRILVRTEIFTEPRDSSIESNESQGKSKIHLVRQI